MDETVNILVVDDEKGMVDSLKTWLEDDGHTVTAAGSGREAIDAVEKEDYDIAIVDLKMPEMDGIQLMEKIKGVLPSAEVIIITAYATVESAVEAIKKGACDYIIKPFTPDEISILVDRIARNRRLFLENIYLKKELSSRYTFQNIVGKSDKMREIYDLVETIADSDVPVIIHGESGTGKELIARAIHYTSRRKDKPFFALNCGALTETLIESELFGYEKGSFTGAINRKKGKFELTHDGTLFLDEVGEMSPRTQIDLLRVLEEKAFYRIGGDKLVRVDVRVIAATNKNLEREITKGSFREDLFYRLNVVSLELPSLRERREDIPLLARHFIGQLSKAYGKEIVDLSQEALQALLKYGWPGNVRELENCMEQAVIFCRGNHIETKDLPDKIRRGYHAADQEDNKPLRESIEQYEKEIVLDALKRCGFKKKEAAHLLGISQRSISYYVKKYGITSEDVYSG